MANFMRINDQFSISPQLAAGDIESVATAGFKTIINLRPDGEKSGYPGDAEVAGLASGQGLGYRHVPIPVKGAMPDVTPQRIDAFGQALDDLPGPVLAYCGTGRRAVLLWALCSAGKRGVEEILSCCAAAGHDLSPIRPVLEQRAQLSASN